MDNEGCLQRPSIKIEKGIPLPTSRNNWKSILEKWEIGDSILIKNRNELNSLNTSCKKHEQRILSQQDQNGGTGFRVWRIK